MNTGTRVKSKRRLPLLILSLGSLLFLPGCETTLPVSLSYATQMSGHDVTAAYSKEAGLVIAAAQLRVLTSPDK